MPPACPFLLETPQPQRQFTMREMSLAVLLCVLPVRLSCRQLRPGSGAHLPSHGRDEPGSGKVDRGTDGHAPRLAQPPVPRPSPQDPQRRSPPACGGACPAPAPAHSTGRIGEEERKLCEMSVTEVTDLTGVSVLSEHASRAGCYRAVVVPCAPIIGACEPEGLPIICDCEPVNGAVIAPACVAYRAATDRRQCTCLGNRMPEGERFSQARLSACSRLRASAHV